MKLRCYASRCDRVFASVAEATNHELSRHEGAQTCWDERRKCPDDGTCHHRCGPTTCFRVSNCAPFTGTYGTDMDDWPDDVIASYPDKEYVW